MKNLKNRIPLFVWVSLFFIGIVFFSGCDAIQFTGPQGEQGEQGEKGDKGDPGKAVEGEETPVDPGPEVDPFTPIELTGERFEKYYLVPTTPTEKEYFDAASPSTVGADISTLAPIVASLPTYQDGNYRTHSVIAGSSGYNQISLYDIPLINLITKTPTLIRASGTVAAAGLHASSASRDQSGDISYYYYYLCGSAVFDASITVSNIDHKPVDNNVYDVHDPFTGSLDNLILPKTDDYASPITIDHDVVFSVSVPASTFESICPETFTLSSACSLTFMGGNINHNCDPSQVNPATYKFPVNQTLEIPKTLPHTAESRNFYQYSTLTVKYPKEASLLDITPSSIVESYTYDETTNTITVTFTEYDTPYVGDVLSFTIMSDDGRQEDKVIAIAE